MSSCIQFNCISDIAKLTYRCEKNKFCNCNSYKLWHSVSHRFAIASEGIFQSPRGDKPTDPTFGPSGIHDRLNC